MSVFSPAKRTAANAWLAFAHDRRGSIAPLFALVLIVVFGVGGLALDSDRGTRIKARLVDAADAANLAAAHAAIDMAKTDGQRSKTEIAEEAAEIGRAYFVSQSAALGGATVNPPQLSVDYENGTWSSKIQYSGALSASLSATLGLDTIAVAGNAEAKVAPGFAALDIAMCIDSTGSMTPTLDAVKANALNFFDNLNTELKSRNLEPFPLVRVRMIYFKDFGDMTPGLWDPDPLRASAFFSLPSDAANFSAFASPQIAFGGGDAPESGVECLNEAIDSPWLKPGDVPSGFSDPVTDVYPLVIVWTDTATHSFGYPNSLANPMYPPSTKMPRTNADMLAKWNSDAVIDQKHKQLLFFGDPDIYPVDGGGDESAWLQVKTWPRFTVGGTLLEANASLIQFLVDGISKSTKALSVTQ